MSKRAAATQSKQEFVGCFVSQTLRQYVDLDPEQDAWAESLQPSKKLWKTTLLRAAVMRTKEVGGELCWVVQYNADGERRDWTRAMVEAGRALEATEPRAEEQDAEDEEEDEQSVFEVSSSEEEEEAKPKQQKPATKPAAKPAAKVPSNPGKRKKKRRKTGQSIMGKVSELFWHALL